MRQRTRYQHLFEKVKIILQYKQQTTMESKNTLTGQPLGKKINYFLSLAGGATTRTDIQKLDVLILFVLYFKVNKMNK